MPCDPRRSEATPVKLEAVSQTEDLFPSDASAHPHQVFLLDLGGRSDNGFCEDAVVGQNQKSPTIHIEATYGGERAIPFRRRGGVSEPCAELHKPDRRQLIPLRLRRHITDWLVEDDAQLLIEFGLSSVADEKGLAGEYLAAWIRHRLAIYPDEAICDEGFGLTS